MRSLPGFVVAGTHSGVGKTTVSLGVMAALRRRGMKVQPFKIGPDFIDPGLHSRACGVPSYNLDGWMLSRNYNRQSLRNNLRHKDVAVVEGMMGLYDGRSGATEEGSTAEMAKLLGLPVILVVDASAMARSAAAMVLGYRLFDRKTNVMGVIFNRIAGTGHLDYLREAMASSPMLDCFGGIPARNEIKIPERHLGLTVAKEGTLSKRIVDQLARLIEEHIDLNRLLRKMRNSITAPATGTKTNPRSTKTPVVAVASDKAFCFYYPDNLQLIEKAGAKLSFFSPMTHANLPRGTRGIYLGGGYPELFAKELSRNRALRAAIRRFVEAGGPVYAECGGLMFLTETLTDCAGWRYPMVGAYPFKTRMLPQLKALGYREVVAAKPTFIARGEKIRGHEFHYSELCGFIRGKKIETVYSMEGPDHKKISEGYRYKNCLGSYVHLHFGSNPEFARRFVAACGGSQSLGQWKPRP
jgi:cobyrinic acid a,c-diamide synthase